MIMLVKYSEGRCTENERKKVEKHLVKCSPCRKTFAESYSAWKTFSRTGWETASDEEVRWIMTRLKSSEKKEKTYAWVRNMTSDLLFLPGFSLMIGIPEAGTVRRNGPAEKQEVQHSDISLLTKDFGSLCAYFYVEKTGAEGVSIRVTVIDGKEKAANVRLIFLREGGGTVSHPLAGDYEYFEYMPFGDYTFLLKQNAEEKGRCRIRISEKEICVKDDYA
ncbi:MAG: zf-HC2 domain-containing protein [Desulfobacterales bacterium]